MDLPSLGLVRVEVLGLRRTVVESMAAESSKGRNGKGEEEVEDLLNRLDLHEDDGDDFVWEEAKDLPEVKAKWLAMARVHTIKGFSPSALYADMRSAWNPAQQVRWRLIEENLFTVQFACLGDWNKAMHGGPWLFRNQAVILVSMMGLPILGLWF